MNHSRTVILDIFGTLATIDRPHRAFSLLRQAMEAENTAFGQRAMSEPHTLTSLAQAMGRVDPQTLSGIERLLWDEVASIRLFPESIAVLGELLANEVRVVLASNLALPFGSALEPLLDPVGPWDHLEAGNGQALLAYSYHLGLLKPDMAFYQTIATKLKLQPETVWMIGDRLEEDCEAPARMGWAGYHLKRHTGENLMDAMLSLGLLK